MKLSLHSGVVCAIIFMGLFSGAAFVSADAPPVVVINEFSSNGSGSDWVELLNTTGSSINLSGWYLVVATSSVATTTLSGTLPANGILTFATPLADGGAVINLQQGNTIIQSAAYGTAPSPVVTAPGAGQSAAFTSPSTWANGTPTKGWFNGSPAPTIASIVSGINGGGVTTNWGTGGIPDSSAATGLYFEKTGKGRVTFTATLNLTDASTTAFLQNLGTYMDASAGSMKFDARTATQLKDAGAEIKMYGLDALGYTDAPALIVKDDDGNVISGAGILSGVSYAAGTLTFTAAHFTQFDVDNSIYVATSTGDDTTGDGTQGHPYKSITKSITAVPTGGTVHVAAGTYNENVVIGKGLTLQTTAGAVIAPAAGPGVEIDASPSATPVTIDGFTITPQGSATDTAQGIIIGKATSPVATHNIIIRNNTITTLGANMGLLVRGVGSNGSGYPNSSNLTVTHNSITVGGDSTAMYASWVTPAHSNWSITNNTFNSPVGVNLELYDVNGVTVDHNTFDAAGSGGSGSVFISAELTNITATTTFSNNNVQGNGAGSMVAFITNLKTGGSSTMDNVSITGNTFDHWAAAGRALGIYPRVTTVAVNQNSFVFTGGSTALRNTSSGSVDATKNWWSNAASTTVAGLISGTVTYSPWWADAAMTELRYTTTSSGGEASTTVVTAVASTTTTGAGNVTINIPAGIVITGPSSWDGTINLPTATTTTVNPVADSGNNATVVGSIEVGFGNTLLTFDKAVKLTFVGQAGNYIGYSHGPGTFHQITAICTDNTQTTNDLLAAGADCKISNDGSGNLVVWTKHFSLFTTYTQSAIPPSGGGGGGGGGGPVGLIGTTNGVVGNAVIPTSYTGTGYTGGTTGGTTGGEVLGASAYNFTRALSVGSTGAEVTALQQFLIDSGYSIPAGATGYFGAQTRAAVIAFQKANGLAQVGVVGPLTRALLNRGVTPTSGTSARYFTRALSVGSTGAEVTALQNLLAKVSGYTGPITGYFGALTKAAVTKYQTERNISAIGIVGPLTRAALNRETQ